MDEATPATYRKLLSYIVPGRRDGLVAIVLLLSCLLSFAAWSLGLDAKLATRPNSFAAFDSLKMLQLFVADDTLHTSKPAREQLQAGLRKQVPHLETLHLVTLPETGN